MGLTINQEKTTFMEVISNKTNEKHIIIDNRKIEKVSEFQYLGSIVTCDNNINVEINHRLTMGNKSYYGFQNLLRSKLPRKETKCKICKTLIKPIVLYGSESWALTKVSEVKLKIFERIIVRKIYSPMYVNGVWRIKYIDGLHKLFKEPNAVQSIKLDRLKWLGHIRRMDEGSFCKKLTSSNLKAVERKEDQS
jgi:hypothetical protein